MRAPRALRSRGSIKVAALLALPLAAQGLIVLSTWLNVQEERLWLRSRSESVARVVGQAWREGTQGPEGLRKAAQSWADRHGAGEMVVSVEAPDGPGGGVRVKVARRGPKGAGAWSPAQRVAPPDRSTPGSERDQKGRDGDDDSRPD